MDGHARFFTKKLNIVLVAVLCTLLWGSAYPAVKSGFALFQISRSDISGKLLFAGLRFALAGLIVLTAYRLMNRSFVLPARKALPKLLLLGIMQTTVQYIFFYIGLANTTGVNGAIISATITFFSVILAHFVYKDDRINLNKSVGCITGFIGVAIIILPAQSMTWSFNLLGDGFLIISSLSASIAMVYSKHLSTRINPIFVTGWQLFLGGILLILAGLMTGGRVAAPSAGAIALLLYMAALSAVAFTLWTTLLKYNAVGKISVYNFLIPIFGALLSALFLHESILQLKNVSALALVSLGIYLANRK